MIPHAVRLTRQPPALGSAAPMRYPSDELTDAERARLAPHFTDLDGPVFALVNLPETVKGALFARYSRYPGTLRRLFLDEFADSLPEHDARATTATRASARPSSTSASSSATATTRVAQLGGAHVACEWTSNILTKILQRPRLGAYLEQSHALHRLRRADARRRLPLLPRPRARPASTSAAMDSLFDAYAEALPIVRAWVDETYPRADGESDAARRRAVNAKALRPAARPAARRLALATWASTRPARPTSS